MASAQEIVNSMVKLCFNFFAFESMVSPFIDARSLHSSMHDLSMHQCKFIGALKHAGQYNLAAIYGKVS